MNNKGNALMWVYTLVVAAFLVGAGVIALSSFQTAALEPTAVTQNITLINGTAVALSHQVLSWTSLANASNTSQLVPATNYTVASSANPSTVTLIQNGTWNNTLVTASYSWSANTTASGIIGSFVTALGNFATQAATIGTMVGIGMLIAVVFGALAYFAIRKWQE